jgi:hypothetical protein
MDSGAASAARARHNGIFVAFQYKYKRLQDLSVFCVRQRNLKKNAGKTQKKYTGRFQSVKVILYSKCKM